jgi:cytoskeletal protein RodZ
MQFKILKKGRCKMKENKELTKDKKKELRSNNLGMTTVEVILIVVVLVGLVLIFKTQIQQLAETVFQKIAADSASILA